jgi:outer membrane receptor protein involved in Fe transport
MQTLSQTSNKETFYSQNGSFKNADTTQKRNFVGDHYVELCLEQAIDSINTLMAKTYIHFTTTSEKDNTYSALTGANDINNQTITTRNNNDLNSWRINSMVVFNHKIKKKKINFTWSGGFNSVKSNGLDNLYSLTNFYEAPTFTDQIRELNVNNNNTTTQFKSGMNLTKSFKNSNITVYYNFNSTNTIQDKLAQNAALQNIRIDTLTVFYSNDALLNCIGTNFSFNLNKFQATIGVAEQQIQLKGNYAMRNNTPDLADPMNKSYANFLPSIALYYTISKKASFNGSYGENINIPTMNQLMPIGNINNPSLIIEGNPDLQPSRSHNYGLSYRYYNMASMFNINFAVNYSDIKNTISNSQTTRTVDQVGWQTITRPENMKGFANWTGFNASLGYPLIKKKLTMQVSGRLTLSTTPTFINGIENVGKNTGTSMNTSFNL